jgi:hypothetical protein
MTRRTQLADESIRADHCTRLDRYRDRRTIQLDALERCLTGST